MNIFTLAPIYSVDDGDLTFTVKVPLVLAMLTVLIAFVNVLLWGIVGLETVWGHLA